VEVDRFVKRFVTLAGAAALGSTLLAGCGNSRFTEPELGYSFTVPSGFQPDSEASIQAIEQGTGEWVLKFHKPRGMRIVASQTFQWTTTPSQFRSAYHNISSLPHQIKYAAGKSNCANALSCTLQPIPGGVDGFKAILIKDFNAKNQLEEEATIFVTKTRNFSIELLSTTNSGVLSQSLIDKYQTIVKSLTVSAFDKDPNKFKKHKKKKSH
jgi:hypothetical protein